jgi:Endonuclease NucS
MKHWIFCATAHRDFGISDPMEILRQRFSDRFWGLGKKTPNRRDLKAGDRVVFYLGLPHKAFAASAVLESDSFDLNPTQQANLSHGMEFYRTEYGVRLVETNTWEQPRRVETVVQELSFIQNDNWGVYLQGGVRYLPEADFEAIMRGSIPVESLGGSIPFAQSAAVFASQSEFALESHLEEFIDKNWNRIDFGRKLTRYATDEENGRQFPAGQWSIDFLCTDTSNGNLVVVELKKGQTSDATVSQILQYITWVEENIADQGQHVEGIIVAKEIDDSLRYALKKQPHVQVLTYRVDFTFQKPVQTGNAAASHA